MPKPVQEAAMPQRFAPLVAVLLVIAQANRVLADPYTARSFGSGPYSVSSVDYTWFDAQRGRSVPVRIYYPTGGSELEKFPLVLFSTGLGRSRDDCAYLGRHWASCGYVSVHVQHKGSDEEVRQGNLRPRKELQRAFYAPENIRNRPLDIIFAIDQLEAIAARGLDARRPLRSDADRRGRTRFRRSDSAGPGRRSVAGPTGVFRAPREGGRGHEFARPARTGPARPGFRRHFAALPAHHGHGRQQHRRHHQGVATPAAFRLYSGADQYLVTFYGADHMTCSGHLRAANATHDAMFQRLIAECSAVFWDAYLKDDAGAKAWLTGGGLRAHLGAAGWVEEKPAADRPSGK